MWSWRAQASRGSSVFDGSEPKNRDQVIAVFLCFTSPRRYAMAYLKVSYSLLGLKHNPRNILKLSLKRKFYFEVNHGSLHFIQTHRVIKEIKKTGRGFGNPRPDVRDFLSQPVLILLSSVKARGAWPFAFGHWVPLCVADRGCLLPQSLMNQKLRTPEILFLLLNASEVNQRRLSLACITSCCLSVCCSFFRLTEKEK